MKIIVTGSLSFDHIFNLPVNFSEYILPEKVHNINVSFTTRRHTLTPGGTGGNQAYTLALLGHKPILIAAVGGDYGDYRQWLTAKGIDTSYIRVFKEENTAFGSVMTDVKDNQIWLFSKGAISHAQKISLKPVFRQHKSAYPLVVIAPNEPEAINRYLDECIEMQVPFVFDPAFYIPQLRLSTLRKGVRHARIIFGNDYEIAMMSKLLKKPLAEFKSADQPEKIIVTTYGAKGSLIEKYLPKHTEKIKIKAAKVRKVVDPTGAGDAYRAGFLAGFVTRASLQKCGQMGSVAAAYAIEKYGTMSHSFRQAEFKKRYRSNYHES